MNDTISINQMAAILPLEGQDRSLRQDVAVASDFREFGETKSKQIGGRAGRVADKSEHRLD